MTDMTGDTHRKSGRIGVTDERSLPGSQQEKRDGGLQENTVEHMRKVKSQVTTASEPHALVFRENKQLCPSLRDQKVERERQSPKEREGRWLKREKVGFIENTANQELKEKKKTEERKKKTCLYSGSN